MFSLIMLKVMASFAKRFDVSGERGGVGKEIDIGKLFHRL
jgi:hypothetical protein